MHRHAHCAGAKSTTCRRLHLRSPVDHVSPNRKSTLPIYLGDSREPCRPRRPGNLVNQATMSTSGGAGAAGAGGAVPAGGATGAAGSGGTGGTAGTGGARALGAGGTTGARGAGGAGGATGAAGTGGAGGTTGARGRDAARARGAAGAGGAGGATVAAGAGGAGAAGAGGADLLVLEVHLVLEELDVLLVLEALELEVLELLKLLELEVLTDQSQPQLLLGSLLPAPAPHTEVTESLTEGREPETRASTPVLACRVARPRPPAVPGTHGMALRPSSVPQRVVLPEPPASSLSHSTEVVDFAAMSRLDYVASLVTESESVCPPSVGGELALSSDTLEDRQLDLECLAAALPRFASMQLCPEGDPDAHDIPTPRSYAEAIAGEYSSQWQIAMDAKMASWKSTGTYRDYELHSLDFSTVFLQGSLHEEICTSGMWLVLGGQGSVLTYLLTDLGERPLSPPVLYVDNKAMLALCYEQRMEHRTKHVALRYFIARELQQPHLLRLSYVASRANTADVFTKALGSGDH
ncbi:unnamed protein product [Closterium sp. NIES-53]